MTVHKPPDEVLLPTVRSHWFASKLSTPIIGIGGAVPRSRKRPRTHSKNTPTPSKKTPAPSKKTPAPCKKTPPLYDRVCSARLARIRVARYRGASRSAPKPPGLTSPICVIQTGHCCRQVVQV